jgi:hypothetical protein
MDMAVSDTLLGLPAGLGVDADEIGSRRRPTGLKRSANGRKRHLRFTGI